MHAQAATAFPAAFDPSFTVVGQAAEARAEAILKRFELAIQSVLDAPLDGGRVLEWTKLRAAGVRA